MTLSIGDTAPNFTAPIDTLIEGLDEITLSDLQGEYVVLYFYPKDSTPGCTKQACAFRDTLQEFKNANARIIGVSKDSVKRHDNFKTKHDLNFPLVSDESGAICESYGTWVEKSMYGKTYMGIQRATFLIDPTGKIVHIWPKVRVKDHIDDVLQILKAS